MQHLHARVYGNAKFAEGFQSFVLMGIEGNKARVLQTATLRADTIPLKALREGKVEPIQVLSFRGTLLERLARAKRCGQKVDCKELKEIFAFLRTGVTKVEKCMATITKPEIVEKRVAQRERAIKNKDVDNALVEAKQARLMIERAEAEAAAEKKVLAVQHKAKTGLKLGSKMEIVANMLLRPEGASVVELCAATGWKTCGHGTFRKIANRVTIARKDRIEGTLRYYGERVS